MALYFYFNETTGDLVYSDQATYSGSGYTSLGEQTVTNPINAIDWVFNSKRASIKTVSKDSNLSEQINILTNMNYMFSDCISLISLDLSGFDTSTVTEMVAMFENCNALTSLDLSGFNTSAVKQTANIFNNCNSLISLDLSGFDMSAVTHMGYMFRNCTALTSLNLSSFDTSSMTSRVDMFKGCSALRIIDISLNMSNILSVLPAATYYDAITRQPYTKESIPGGSTYVRDLDDLNLVATMVQTRTGINVAKRLAYKALNKSGSINVGDSSVDIVRTTTHSTSYTKDTLEIVTDSTGKVTEMWFVTAD